jgi:predicted nucleotidyltransferase component of viral defense system
LIKRAEQEGYSGPNARAKVCQDIILKAISESSFNRKVTIKGGVVMRSVSSDARRATQDIDMDFIRYSISDDAIDEFLSKLNCLGRITIERTGKITKLKQQDYHGKRVLIQITDVEGTIIRTKMDIGVHKNFSLEQDEYCFDIAYLDDGPTLLINSKEQMFTEKLRSILKFGPTSTRYKDIFDMYYLAQLSGMNWDKLRACIKLLILDDEGMRENTPEEMLGRIKRTLSNRSYRQKLSRARKNWLDVDSDTVLEQLASFLEKILKKS